MPRGRTSHLRSVIGNDDAGEVVLVQYPQGLGDVDIAVIDECFFVSRDFPPDVSKVDVGDFSLTGAACQGIVDTVFGHFGGRSDTKFNGISRAGPRVEKALIQVRLVNEPWLRTNNGQRWVVRMGSKRYTGFLRHREDRFKEFTQAVPEFVGGRRWDAAGGSLRIVNHVPSHAVGHRAVAWTIHAYGFRAAAGEWAFDPGQPHPRWRSCIR